MLSQLRYKFGTLEYDLSARTHIVGVLNITPDSFSDGGRYLDKASAIQHGLKMLEQGADIIDVGGESSRPGADPISDDEELSRVLPVIEGLAAQTKIPISIDTYKSSVARNALKAGASIVNDISGLTFDPEMVDVVAESGASVVVMHMKGTPKTMQQNPYYDDVIGEIRNFFEARVEFAQQRGIRQVILDPGIGFGKRLEHNLEILRRLNTFEPLGYPLMVGPSRKSFIGMILDLPVESRLEGTAAAIAVSVLNGVHLVRVHDVLEMKRVALVVDAIKRGATVRAPV